jgi:hypothetical protein
MKTGRQLRQSQPPGQGEENETNTNIEVDTREGAAFNVARLRFRNHIAFRGKTRLIRHVVAGVTALERGPDGGVKHHEGKAEQGHRETDTH